jgi:hypothetical protein
VRLGLLGFSTASLFVDSLEIVRFNAKTRFTKDIVLWVRDSAENVRRLEVR